MREREKRERDKKESLWIEVELHEPGKRRESNQLCLEFRDAKIQGEVQRTPWEGRER